LRQGIRMVTVSSLIVCMLPKRLRGLGTEFGADSEGLSGGEES
jgi:hypothetical protein